MLAYLEFNKTHDLRLIGGSLEKLNISTLHLGNWTQHLRLAMMPSYNMDQIFESQLPDSLETFHVWNCD